MKECCQAYKKSILLDLKKLMYDLMEWAGEPDMYHISKEDFDKMIKDFEKNWE